MSLRCGNARKALLLLSAVGTFAHSSLFAQQEPRSNKENSPYSRYGIGDIRTGTSPLLRAMANVSSAYASSTAVNTDNPASYATLKLTTYEVGGEGSLRTLRTTDQRFRTGTATVSYLAIGLPLGKHAGMALGIRPQTRVFYDVVDSISVTGIGKVVQEYRGDGGLNYAFVGLAGKYQGFSAGVNVGYSFGTLETGSFVNNIDTSAALNTEITRNTRIGGIYWKGGLLYETYLTKDKGTAIRVGGTITLRQSLNATRNEYSVAYNYLNGATLRDTPYVRSDLKGEYTLPLSYSGGVMVIGQRWSAGLDVQRTAWDQYRVYGQRDSVASSSLRVALGGEYTPSTAANAKYFSRVAYRLGVFTGHDYVMLRNTDLPIFGVTFGASLPIRKTSDRLHTAFEIGRRGTTTNGLVQESYFRFALGISLNDRWFIKRRYD